MKSMLKKMTALALGACLLLGSVQAAQTEDYTDVSKSHWAYSYIRKAAYADLVSGIGNGKFGPEQTVSGGQFVVMVAKLFYPKQVEEFAEKNTTGDWWRPYLGAANHYGLLEQTELNDRKNGWISTEYRQENWTQAQFDQELDRYTMAMMLFNLNSQQQWGTTTQAQMKAAAAKIADWNKIPEKYQEAVACAYARGFLSGVDQAGNFAGEQTMTRAQSAVVLCKLADIKKEWDARGNYPTNSKGHTYGLDDDYLRYGVYPDLVPVVGVNGNVGYCFYKELSVWDIRPDGHGQAEMLAYHFAQPDFVNVYDLDENVIDAFEANGGKLADTKGIWDYVTQEDLDEYFACYKAYFEEQGYTVTNPTPQRTDLLPSEYPKKPNGLTYGRDEDVLHYGFYPDLIHVIGVDGKHGYAFKREMDLVSEKSAPEPEEIAAFTLAQPEWINVYGYDEKVYDKIKPEKAEISLKGLDQAKLAKYFSQYKAYFEKQGYEVKNSLPSTKS